MTRYAVSGSSAVPSTGGPAERELLLIFEALTDAHEITTGAAWGIDTLAYHAAVATQPKAAHRVVYPRAAHNEALVREAIEAGYAVYPAKAGRTSGSSYMKRNDELVRNADVLLAWPPTEVEAKRGGPGAGTWSTIRRARKAGKAVIAFPLNGADAWWEGPSVLPIKAHRALAAYNERHKGAAPL